jgi:16S rRNA (adenine1518-N6/adenine1519-N6)-dimethyltransferase
MPSRTVHQLGAHDKNPPGPRTSLTSLGVRPAKSRGQNFLVQAAIANRVVDAGRLSPADYVIEIGPGLGILSERIAAHPIARYTMVELEPKLAVRLEERFAGDRRIRVVTGDFLKIDFAALCDRVPVKVIGNLPFNAAAAILAQLCSHHAQISRMVLMFQREVGERIRARAGDSAYGALSVYTSLYFKVESHFRVSAGNFHPRPKIDAEVLIFAPHLKLPFTAQEESRVLETVRAAFFAPRKTLRNSIALALRMNPNLVEQKLGSASIDPGARAETLEPADFIRLAHHLWPVITGSNA